MSTSRDTPNPLRPYYIPPSIGLAPDPVQGAGAHGIVGRASASVSSPAASSTPAFGTAARDILSDIDYGDYLPETSPSVTAMMRKLVDQAIWKYTSVLLAQPFEVAMTVLQCHTGAGSARPSPRSTVARPRDKRSLDTARESYEDSPYRDGSEEESDGDSPSYFTATAPSSAFGTNRPPGRRPHTPSRSHSHTPTPGPSSPPYKLELRRQDSILEVLSQLWTKEGAWGIWKGTNATFVYNVLLKTIESWMRSLLSALLNLPDPGLSPSVGVGVGGLDIVDSPSPLMSLGIAVAAAGIAGLALAPLDIIRTRLILTPVSAPPRAIIPSLRHLDMYSCPLSLLPVTLLHSTVPTLFSASAPLVLRSSFSIDPVITPTTYSIATFLASTAELFIRLPFETVLRHGHVAVLRQRESRKEQSARRDGLSGFKSHLRGQDSDGSVHEPLQTVVDVGPYHGVFGTMWTIAQQSPALPSSTGVSHPTRDQRFQNVKPENGQGVFGLWRGWRVGFWGLVGVWGAAALGRSGGGEF